MDGSRVAYALVLEGFAAAARPVRPVREAVAEWATLTDLDGPGGGPWKDGEFEVAGVEVEEAWRFRAWHRDPTDPGTAWQVDVLATGRRSPTVVVTLRSADVPIARALVVDHRPSRVADLGGALVGDRRLATRDAGRPVRAEPVAGLAGPDLAAFARSLQRRLHLCVVPDGPGPETHRLARELAGLAHVAVSDGVGPGGRLWSPGPDSEPEELTWPDERLGAVVRRRVMAEGLARRAADLVATFDEAHRLTLTAPR